MQKLKFALGKFTMRVGQPDEIYKGRITSSLHAIHPPLADNDPTQVTLLFLYTVSYRL